MGLKACPVVMVANAPIKAQPGLLLYRIQGRFSLNAQEERSKSPIQAARVPGEGTMEYFGEALNISGNLKGNRPQDQDMSKDCIYFGCMVDVLWLK